MSKKIAVQIRPVVGFKGNANLYKLQPEHEHAEYVIVSTLPDEGETVVFASDAHGEIHRRILANVPNNTHRAALAEIGYQPDAGTALREFAEAMRTALAKTVA
jgi:hypothetical protein